MCRLHLALRLPDFAPGRHLRNDEDLQDVEHEATEHFRLFAVWKKEFFEALLVALWLSCS